MSTAIFLVHPGRPDALALTLDTAQWIAARGHTARILEFTARDRVSEDGREEDMAAVDLRGATVVVSMGGDGTFLRAVRLAWAEDIPVLGVNFGRVGYLPDLVPEDVREALTRVFEGRAVIESRCALEVAIDEAGADRSLSHDAGSRLAFNEVVLEKIIFGHTVCLGTSIDGEEMVTYSADGLLIATPTGSTAYNLSAGGPILSPGLRAMVITALAPHLSLDRSLVLTDEQRFAVEIAAARAVVLVLDGEEIGRLEPGSTVTCQVATRPVRVVRNEAKGFGGMLRIRLLADRTR